MNIKNPKQALNPAFLKQKPDRLSIETFKKEAISLLDKINEKESEEFHKNLIIDFFNYVYYKDNHYINTKGRTDLVIHNNKSTDSPVGVLIEVKKPTNKSEMVTKSNLNTKSFQELLLYYLRERKSSKNLGLRHLIITNINEWFVFDAQDFEKAFYANKNLVKNFEEFETKIAPGTSTDFFYKDIASPEIEKVKLDIPYTYFNIKDFEVALRNADKNDDKKLIALYKFLSPTHLLKLPLVEDYNQLNKDFYAELLHILGLEERKEKSQKFIVRKALKDRDNGSIIENTINELDSMGKLSRLPNKHQYGQNYEDQLFNIALELAITWINRILFLKLLEAQIIKYHNNNKKYSFLSPDKIEGYDDLNSLFFQILARKEEDRKDSYLTERFSHVPYLNSSLFELTELEDYTIAISNLRDKAQIKLHEKSVLRKKASINNIYPLDYLLRFLDAYDFSSEGSEDIQEENKPLISASVLGLIFEKINGYKDGSFFTPSSITMYMCKETITSTIIQKFNEVNKWECTCINDLYNQISHIEKKEANDLFNAIKICDPAVGSGHFLVSALNEIIALKSELGILVDKNGKRLRDYKITVGNDELIISDKDYGIFKYIPGNAESQRVQETLFNEKRLIIENCLFGVDINPNSVKICQLRLWIELLKHTYYKPDTNRLETLPNIDINIKCGNSLISRFSLDEDLKPILKGLKISISDYKDAVCQYKNAHNKEDKKRLESFITEIKYNLKTEINRNDKNVKELIKHQKTLAELNIPMLFERSPKEQKAWKIKKEETQKKIDNYKTIIEGIKNNKIYQNALEWRIEFPEVLNDDGDYIGFDTIIGNPPYMRIQGIRDNDQAMADMYNSIYDSATGSYDLYTLFTEKSLSLIQKNSFINFIMPVKWTNAAFGKGLRSVISSEKAIDKIINFGSLMVFEASTYTGLHWFKKGSQTLKYIDINNITSPTELATYLNNITEKEFNEIPSRNLTEQQWVLSKRSIMDILDKLNKHPRRISDIFDKIFQGLATSKDDVYFLYNCISDEQYITGYSKYLSAEIKIERDFVKPLLKGEDVHRYELIKSDKFVIFPYKKENETTVLYTEKELEKLFPLGYAYLKQCEQALRNREKGRFNIDNEWFQYGRKQGINYAEHEKIVAPEISKGGNFSYDKKGDFYSTTTVYGYIKRENTPESYKCLLGILNSNLFWWYMVNTGTTLANSYFRFKPDYIKPFPIPAIIPSNIECKIVEYVDKITYAKINGTPQNIIKYETIIDEIIYSIYGLSEDEIKYIISVSI